MPKQFVPSIEARGKDAQKPFHPGHQIRLRRLDHQMKIIRHEDVGVNLPARLLADLAQRFQKTRPVLVIAKNFLLSVPAIHHVANGPCIF